MENGGDGKINPLRIPIPNKVGLTELRAIVNVLNQIIDDMYDKKVKQIENDTNKNLDDASELKNQSAADNEAILDLDFRVSELGG